MTRDEYQALDAIRALHAHYTTKSPTPIECNLAVSLYRLVRILAQDSQIVTEALDQFRAWIREGG